MSLRTITILYKVIKVHWHRNEPCYESFIDIMQLNSPYIVRIIDDAAQVEGGILCITIISFWICHSGGYIVVEEGAYL